VASLNDEEKQVHALQLLFLLIPDSNYQLLRDTLLLLNSTAKVSSCFTLVSFRPKCQSKVFSQEENHNKMSASNLATVFASHLLCPRKLSAEVLQSNNHVRLLSYTSIINY